MDNSIMIVFVSPEENSKDPITNFLEKIQAVKRFCDKHNVYMRFLPLNDNISDISCLIDICPKRNAKLSKEDIDSIRNWGGWKEI
jgi:hypothetical protein